MKFVDKNTKKVKKKDNNLSTINISTIVKMRNYLHGYIPHHNLSPLTVLQNILNNRKITIFIGTWNMNGQYPPENLDNFIVPQNSQNTSDLIVIGSQEIYKCNMKNWENAIKNIIGPSYILKSKCQFGKLHMIMFLRRELNSFTSILKKKKMIFNKLKIYKTKGALMLGLMIFGTSLLFIATHLTAHTKNNEIRRKEIKKLIHSPSTFYKTSSTLLSRGKLKHFDSVFLFGDLNFRINRTRKEVMDWIHKTHFFKEPANILIHDQLHILLHDEKYLQQFQEGPITFPPTYKYNHGSHILDSSHKHRTPSYTDRIIFKNNNCLNSKYSKTILPSENGKIECLAYDSVRSICSSDHKPVFGIYNVTIRMDNKLDDLL